MDNTDRAGRRLYPMPKHQAESYIQQWGDVSYPVARVINWLGVVVMILLGGVVVYGGIDGLSQGDFSSVGMLLAELLGFCSIFIGIFLFEAALWRPRVVAADLPSVADGPPGLVVRVRRRLDVAIIFFSATATGAVVTGSVMASGGWRIFWALVALPCAFFFVLWSRTFPMSRQMVLTTEGILIQDQRQSAYLAWDDIVSLRWGPGPQMDKIYIIEGRPGAASWRCERRTLFYHPERVRMDVSTMFIDLDPLLLGWALVTYHAYPSLRSELGTEAARARLLDPSYAYAMTPTEVSTQPPFPFYRPRWLT